MSARCLRCANRPPRAYHSRLVPSTKSTRWARRWVSVQRFAGCAALRSHRPAALRDPGAALPGCHVARLRRRLLRNADRARGHRHNTPTRRNSRRGDRDDLVLSLVRWCSLLSLSLCGALCGTGGDRVVALEQSADAVLSRAQRSGPCLEERPTFIGEGVATLERSWGIVAP